MPLVAVAVWTMRSPAPYTLDAVVRGLWTLQGRPWTVSRLHVGPSDTRSQSEHGNDASVHKWRSLSTGVNALSRACLACSFGGAELRQPLFIARVSHRTPLRQPPGATCRCTASRARRRRPG